jgi:chromosome segregation ATPase
MNKITFWALACAIVGFSSPVLAQALPELCEQKGKEIASVEASVAAIDKEIAELNGKLDELNKQKVELTKSLAGKTGDKRKLAAKVAVETAKKKKMCAPLVTCAKYEKDMDGLKAKHEKVFKEVSAIRKAAVEEKQKAAKLKQEMEKIEAEYAKLGCDNLVLGESKQKTVDRCGKLYADWTATQAEIDKVKASIRELKQRNRKQRGGLRAAARAYKNLHKRMRKTCSFSARLPEMEKTVTEQDKYATLDKDIAAADKEAGDAGKVKILKPKVIEKKKEKKAEKAEPKPAAKGKKFGIKLKLDAKGSVDTKKGEAKAKAKAEAEAKGRKGKTKKSTFNVSKKLKLR